MPFATSLDPWLIASAWLATNSFGFNMANLGFMSYWVVPLAYVATLFHHGYLFRDLRRNPSLPIRRVYKLLFPGLTFLWAVGAFASMQNAIIKYDLDLIRERGVYLRQMIGIAGMTSGVMAVIQTGLVITVGVKVSRFESSVQPSQLDKA